MISLSIMLVILATAQMIAAILLILLNRDLNRVWGLLLIQRELLLRYGARLRAIDAQVRKLSDSAGIEWQGMTPSLQGRSQQKSKEQYESGADALNDVSLTARRISAAETSPPCPSAVSSQKESFGQFDDGRDQEEIEPAQPQVDRRTIDRTHSSSL